MKTEPAKKLPNGTVEKIIRIEGAPKERIVVTLAGEKGKKLDDVCDFFGKGALVMRWVPEGVKISNGISGLKAFFVGIASGLFMGFGIAGIVGMLSGLI